MQLVLDNDFLSVYYDHSLALLANIWKESSMYMSDDEFKKILLWWMDYADKHEVIRFLINSQNMRFVVSPEVQEWHDEHIVPRWQRDYVRKFAFVLSTDIFTKVSIEQVLEEGNAQDLQSRNQLKYFDDATQAQKWLCE